MNVLLIEPFFTGSHKAWALGYQSNSEHNVEILSLSGHYWKWRMHGGAVSLAEKFNKSGFEPDIILATDMLDITTFLSLTKAKTHNIPIAVYFHENQLTYPWSPTDRDVKNKRDNHYSFINYTTALAADKVFFNSDYHKQSFLGELPKFLKGFPDNNLLNTVQQVTDKSEVLHLGMDLKKFDSISNEVQEKPKRGAILWNHRWEYDKNPNAFFEALYELDNRGIDFNLVLLGENFSQQPKVFEQAKAHFGNRILHYGYAETFEEYARWLSVSDILPITSNQDFFGGSLVEAMYCNVIPLVPNRLAFPEHFPKEYHSAFIYEDGGLVNRLQRMLMNIKLIRKQQVRQFIEHYDWSNMAAKYDAAIASLVTQH